MTDSPQCDGPLRYIVATERHVRGKVPTALARLTDMEGIDIVGAANPDRVVVSAPPSQIEKLTRQFPDTIHVEPEIMYDKNR